MKFAYKVAALAAFVSLVPVFAYASTSVSIQSISPGTTVAAGSALSFTVSTSGFTSPVFSVSDSFSGSSANTSDIDSSGHFIWRPTANDVGTHTLNINITDSVGDSASVQEVITVSSSASSNPTVAIQGLSPGSAVVVGNTLTFIAAASSFSNPTFTLSDSFPGSSLSNSNITSAGYFTWTPTTAQLGTHTIVVYAADTSGHSANVTLQMLVENPTITVTSISPGNNVNPGGIVNFTLTQAGLTNPSYTITDSFSGTSGTTIANSDINSSGYFTWSPASSQVGTHQLMIYGSDTYGHTATTTVNLYVIQPVQIALTVPSPASTVVPGTTLTFTATSYGFTNPRFAISDGFPGTTLTNANINSAGAVTWTPTVRDTGTHTITVSASDIYSHFSNAQQTITVAGTPVTTPAVTQTTTTTTTAGSGFQFTAYLYQGVTSPDVTQLQNVLAQLGYFSGTANGHFGPLTQAAVIKYQAAHGLSQLGVVGPATRAALNAGASATTSSTNASAGGNYTFTNFLNVGSSGAEVTALQQKLTALNLYSGPITGYFGSLTKGAVEAFQGQHNISQVGFVGPSTRTALNQ